VWVQIVFTAVSVVTRSIGSQKMKKFHWSLDGGTLAALLRRHSRIHSQDRDDDTDAGSCQTEAETVDEREPKSFRILAKKIQIT